MFTKQKIVNRLVGQFEYINGDLWTTNGTQLIVEEKTVINKPISNVIFGSKKCLIVLKDRDVILLNYNDLMTSESFRLMGPPGLLFDDYTILVSELNTKDLSKSKRHRVDILGNRTIWSIVNYFGSGSLIQGCLYGSSKGSLFKISAETGEKIWQSTLTDEDQVFLKILGAFGDIVCVQTRDCNYSSQIRDFRYIIGYDIKDGTEVFRHELEDSYFGLRINRFWNCHLDSEKGVIFNLSGSYYSELNLTTGIKEYHDIGLEVELSKVEPSRKGSWKGRHIFFWEGFKSKKFGVFDRETRKIIATEQIELESEKWPAIIDVKHYDNKLYVHDGNKHLHIYTMNTT